MKIYKMNANDQKFEIEYVPRLDQYFLRLPKGCLESGHIPAVEFERIVSDAIDERNREMDRKCKEDDLRDWE